MNLYEMPEDSVINTEAIQDRMHREKITMGDIDVLAADENKQEIYNIEIKYYKPLANVEEMHSKKKVDERGKNIIRPLRREKVLYENMEEVLHFLGLDPCEAGKNQNYFCDTATGLLVKRKG